MLLQTNSYIVPKEKRSEHARLMRRFRQILNRIGCDNFEVYEQVGANWGNGSATGRFVQIMRFRDRKHQLAVQAAERTDPTAQELIAEFCELVNYPYQQQNGMFAVGFYTSVLPVAPVRVSPPAAENVEEAAAPQPQDEAAAAESAVAAMAAEFQVEESPAQESEEATEQATEGQAQEQFPQQPSFAGAGGDVADDEVSGFERMSLDEDQGGFEQEPVVEEAPVQEQPAKVQETEFVEEEQPAPAPVAEGDDWSLMNEARAFEDEESIGIVLQPGPASQAPAAPEQPANGEPGHGEPEIDLGLDDEEDDDLARMAERLAQEEEDAAKSRRPGRR